MASTLKEKDGVVEGQLKDKSEVLFEQVGAEQWLVDALDPGQLADLLVGQVLGVLPERIARALQPSGMGMITAPASVVPDLAANLVESLGRPGHGMEGVESDDRLIETM